MDGVKPGGMLLITVCDNIGTLSEILRRLIAETICPSSAPVEERLDAIRPFFADHFSSISGTSRPLDHWLMDNLIHNWFHPGFPMDDAIRALQDDFEVFGTSPKFLSDWRWYKQVVGQDAKLNELAIQQYKVNGIAFVNGSRVLPPVEESAADMLRDHAQKLWDYMIGVQDGKADLWPDVAESCKTIAEVLKPYDAETSEAIEEAAVYFQNVEEIDPHTHFNKFISFFGQGQQYISFVRKRDLLTTVKA